MLRIVAAHAYYLVPTARFELAHLAALAPQASVSTNSTTSALNFEPRTVFYGFAGALPAGGAGAAGAGIAVAPEFAPAPGTVTLSGLDAAGAVSAAVSKIVFGASAFLVPM